LRPDVEGRVAVGHIEAVYQGGVFKPLGEVTLPENQRVRLSVEAIEPRDALEWLARVREFQREFLETSGPLPDSTPDIAEDRMRDV
jgi:predicted DNA-binding antitoxin AbrB/MazE fold protein